MDKSDIQTDVAYQYLLNLLCDIDQQTHLSPLLDTIMTEKEQQELINRIKIFAYLQKGTPQREISSTLGVGIATVSRGAKAFRQYRIDELLPKLDSIIDA